MTEQLIKRDKTERREPRRKKSTVTSKLYNTKCDIPTHELESIKRVGIIPYCVFDPNKECTTSQIQISRECGNLWFALAVDAQYGELTDCGGFRKSGEGIEFAAVRELYEESLCIFDARKSLDYIGASPVVVSSNGLCVFFVKVEQDSFGFPDGLPNEFYTARKEAIEGHIEGTNKGKYGTFMENSMMYWISCNDLKRLLAIRTPLKQSKKAELCSRFTFSTFVSDRSGIKGGTRCFDYTDFLGEDRSFYHDEKEISSPSYKIASRRHQQKFHPAPPHKSLIPIPECMPSTILNLSSYNHPIMYELLRTALVRIADELFSYLLTQ